MFDIGASELLVIVAVAILVVAPKDLPKMLRTIGLYLGKAKRMMGDVQKQVNEVMHQAEIDAMREEINKSVMEAESAMKPELGKPSPAKPAETATSAASAESFPDIPAAPSQAQLREAALEKAKTEPAPAAQQPPAPAEVSTSKAEPNTQGTDK